MKYLLIILGLLYSVDAYSQREGHIWHFANYAGLDFNSGVATPVSSKVHGAPPANYYRWSNSTFSKADGTLLFYENNIHPYQDSILDYGIGIFDANDQPVKKSNIDTVNLFYIGHIYGTYFLPFRGSDKIAYVYVDVWNGTCLKYILLSDTNNVGLGGPIDDSVHIVSKDSISPGSGSGGLACVRHANGRDWWVVGHEFLSDTFIVTLFTPDTAYIVHKQQIGTYQGVSGTAFTSGAGGNAMRFNSTGDQLIRGNTEGLVELYSFDRCTGLLSNSRTLSPASSVPNSIGMFDIAFSPNGRFVYAPFIGYYNPQTSWSKLIQFDLLENLPPMPLLARHLYKHPNSHLIQLAILRSQSR
jgi:hypothetical protein